MGTVQEDQVSSTEGDDGEETLLKSTASEEETMGSFEEAHGREDVVDVSHKASSDDQPFQGNVESIHAEQGSVDDGEDEGSDSEYLERDEEEITRGEHGLGPLWRLSLIATLVFVAWAFVGGVTIDCRNAFPDIRERDPVQTIVGGVKMEMSWGDIKALEALLCTSEEQHDRYKSAHPSTSKSSSSLTPGFIGPPPQEKSAARKEEKEKSIPEQVGAYEDLEADSHGRERPEFEYVYKQAVSSNDVYLQMSGKNPSTLCCEDLVMKVKLPRVQSAAEVKLDVYPTYLQLASMDYYLGTTFPHTIKVAKSSAKWDSGSCTLIITLPIVREYDPVSE